MIPVPNSAITVSQMHIPSKSPLSKGSGWGKELLLWSFKENESDIKLNFVLNSSAYIQKNLQTVSIYWEASIFISNNGVLTLFCFLKTMCVLGHQESDFQSSFMPLSFRKMSR